MRRGFLVVWVIVSLAIGGVAWWYLFAPGSVPEGHLPLGDAASFRSTFAASVGKNRIVAFLSPTTPVDLVVAQKVQALLMEYENDALDAFIVWTPKAGGDWAPTTDAMGRVWDLRARHFWDSEDTLRTEAGEGKVCVYARGAGLDKPALRITEWDASLPEIRTFLGTPKRQP